MLRSAIAFCSGAAVVHVLPAPWPPAVMAALAVGAACSFRRAPALAAGFAGCAWALCSLSTALAGAWPCARDRAVVELTGRVAAPAIVRQDRTDFDIDTGRESARAAWPRRIRLSWYEADRVPRAGERWRVRARLRCPRGFANPAVPDRELALLRDHIDATGHVDGDRAPVRLDSGVGTGMQRLREHVAGAIAGSMPAGPSVAVLQGLSVGVRGNIPDGCGKHSLSRDLRTSLQSRACTSPGARSRRCLHCDSPGAGACCRRLDSGPRSKAPAVVAVTAAYAVLSGASVPALRTLAMVALFSFLRCLRRPLPLAEALALAAAILVAGDPLSITSAGFWLSFVATAALLAVGTAGTGWHAWFGGFAAPNSRSRCCSRPCSRRRSAGCHSSRRLPMPSPSRCSAS